MTLGRWRVSLIQMLGSTDKARNVQHAVEMIARAAAAVPAAPPATATQPLVPTANFTAWASLQNADPAASADTVEQVPRLVVLPECFNAPYSTKYFLQYSEPVPPLHATFADIQAGAAEWPTAAALAEAARRHNVWLVGVSIP
jgi:predicted amidohydrolase